MSRKFTANGTFIPQDDTGKDMCILFIKYGRCRFKTKCKKSHWVPPLPDEPYPVEVKPPLPSDVLVDNARANETNTDSSIDTTSISQHHEGPELNSVLNTDFSFSPKTDVPKQKNYHLLPRRFRHVFQDMCENLVAENTGISRLFNEVGAYFDNVAQKLQISKQPENKLEKHHLKVLRRIHWRNTQHLREKLCQCPPSYNLKFDRSKINFTRLRPYVYVLVHECMCVDGEKKPRKPSSFEILIADTLLAFVDSKCITPQEAENKLQQWGARAVRARQCIKHLWHMLAISSRSPDGCAADIIRIEEEVIEGKRNSLDYAYACAAALKRTKLQSTIMENSRIRGKISTSIRQGLETNGAKETKRNLLKNIRGSIVAEHEVGPGKNEKCTKKHLLERSERGQERTQHAEISIEYAKVGEHAGIAKEHVVKREDLHENVQETFAQKDSDELKQIVKNGFSKKRKRSRQFKNVPFNERKKIKTRCIQLLSSS